MLAKRSGMPLAKRSGMAAEKSLPALWEKFLVIQQRRLTPRNLGLVSVKVMERAWLTDTRNREGFWPELHPPANQHLWARVLAAKS